MKLFTTICIVVAFGLFLTWPLILRGHPARGSSLGERKQYAVMLMCFVGGQVVALVGAGVGTALIVRQARKEYREQSLLNMSKLIESVSPSSDKPAANE